MLSSGSLGAFALAREDSRSPSLFSLFVAVLSFVAPRYLSGKDRALKLGSRMQRGQSDEFCLA